ncbi:uncharacterized protein LOC123871117 isoform X2 [Maniola jurtina]|nr:uncharacterized protein LOC123871117 isoform X2 [Maniola jurtina]XP_045770673.1 uncharacterized protein LOC123871117 isoform X2 [Maniola jurtina]XP_045770674.1 uncharacterized protein LOC123871117 isoform X2 [Maniola jurtina]
MGRQSCIGGILAFSLLASAFCLPTSVSRSRRQSSDSSNGDSTPNATDDKDVNNEVDFDQPAPVPFNDDDDNDDDFPSYPQSDSSGGGGSNLFSLLSLVTSFLPGSSSSSGPIQKYLKAIVKSSKPKIIIRRNGVSNNEIDNDYIADLKPPPILKELNKSTANIEIENSKSESNESDNDNNTEEESLENDEERNESDENSIDIDDEDYDEPPGGGDGEGGGLLGLLAGLSGGEDGQSDLGSLLATVSGIIANLSGDGIDLNALIASGIGLFVGLLSEGEENPGEILASYLLTSLDTITGGGAKNNGAFFGKFLRKLVKGTSAGGDPDADSEENNMETKDSAGFFASFLMGLLGDMSKGSSGSYPMRRHVQNNLLH